LDTLQSTVQQTTVGWMNNSLQIATVLFSIMMTVTFVTAIARYASLNHTLEGCGHMFMDLFIKVIPLYVLMAGATTILPNLVDTANQLGGTITGTPVSGPSEIFNYGWQISSEILKASMLPFNLAGAPVVGQVAILGGMITGVYGLIMCIIIMGSFTLIAFEYMLAFVQAYITLSIGAISLGWLASGGTRHMGETYLAGAWMSLMRLIITIGIVGFIVSLVPHMMDKANTTDVTMIIGSWLKLTGAAVFAALLATKVPAFATHAFSGSPAVSAPEVAGVALRSARSAVKAFS